MTRSWKTTTCGVLAAVAAIIEVAIAVLDGKPETVPNWGIVIPSVMTAIGLLFARDNDKTSEQVGAGK